MSLAKSSQTLIRKASLPSNAPKPTPLQTSLRTSATLVTSRLIRSTTAFKAPANQVPARPLSLKKPLTKPPKDLGPPKSNLAAMRHVPEKGGGPAAARAPASFPKPAIIVKPTVAATTVKKPTVSIVTAARPRAPPVAVVPKKPGPVSAVTAMSRFTTAGGVVSREPAPGPPRTADPVSLKKSVEQYTTRSRAAPVVAKPVLVGRGPVRGPPVATGSGRPEVSTIMERGRGGAASRPVAAKKPQPIVPRPVSAAFPLVNRSGVPIVGRPRRRIANPDPYGLDVMTEEDLAFIDDGEGEDTKEWLNELRGVTGYDPTKFRDLEEAPESNAAMIAYEERLSEQIARREDLEEFKKAAVASESDEDDD